MATKEQKHVALKEAIAIIKEYARGGAQKEPSAILRRCYDMLVDIVNEINQSED